MLEQDLPNLLSSYQGRGYITAPAGHGKTHLIAQSVALCTRRQLVLTHTYAGVNAIRKKLRELRVPSGLYHVDTLASWVLRIALAFRNTSGWSAERPADTQWSELYRAGSSLLTSSFIERIIRSSYAGIFVDEYQDCSLDQHEIVLNIANYVPCRILGDSMQAIFEFQGQAMVNWDDDVAANFENLGELEEPHRWIRAGAPDLAAWLKQCRLNLENDEPIDLSTNIPSEVRIVSYENYDQNRRIAQGNACRYFQCDADETVIAIHKGDPYYKSQCHALAKNIGGRFSSIEEIEGKELFSFIQKYAACSSNSEKLKLAITHLTKCLTGVTESLPNPVKRGEKTRINRNTKNPPIAEAANEFLDDANSLNLARYFSAVRQNRNVVRADLYSRTMAVFQKHSLNPQLSLEEAAEKFQSEFRHKGRTTGRRRLIGTTLLVKGLEFDHAIVLDAPSLPKKELYVALTRGSKSLTIISHRKQLVPV